MPSRPIFFIGSKNIGLKALRVLHLNSKEVPIKVVTFNDTKDKRTAYLKIVEYCSLNSIECFTLDGYHGLKNVIDKHSPTLCLVVGWYWIIEKQLLNKVPGGFLGIHASLLPKYRGGAPLVWAMMNNERVTGVTLFYFNEGMDSGDIIGQRSFSILKEDAIIDVVEKSEDAAVELLNEFIPQIMNGTAPRKIQFHQEATYCSQRSEEDGHIDWTQSNDKIYNFIRAQSDPYPGAFSYLNNEKITMLKSSIFQQPYFGPSGKIVGITDKNLTITCGSGAVIIEKAMVGDQIILNFRDVFKRNGILT